jgi:hypothetical protein
VLAGTTLATHHQVSLALQNLPGLGNLCSGNDLPLKASSAYRYKIAGRHWRRQGNLDLLFTKLSMCASQGRSTVEERPCSYLTTRISGTKGAVLASFDAPRRPRDREPLFLGLCGQMPRNLLPPLTLSRHQRRQVYWD